MDYISSPRPLFKEESPKETAGKEVVVLGSTTAGIVIRVGKEGLEFNGYYAGLKEPVKYATMRKFGFISWGDLNKLRRAIGKKEEKAEVRRPDEIEEKVDKKYLESLPVTKMNGQDFYIDTKNKSLRPVDNPNKVYYYKDKPTKKPV